VLYKPRFNIKASSRLFISRADFFWRDRVDGALSQGEGGGRMRGVWRRELRE